MGKGRRVARRTGIKTNSRPVRHYRQRPAYPSQTAAADQNATENACCKAVAGGACVGGGGMAFGNAGNGDLAAGKQDGYSRCQVRLRHRPARHLCAAAYFQLPVEQALGTLRHGVAADVVAVPFGVCVFEPDRCQCVAGVPDRGRGAAADSAVVPAAAIRAERQAEQVAKTRRTARRTKLIFAASRLTIPQTHKKLGVA